MNLVCSKHLNARIYDVDKPDIHDKQSIQSFGDKPIQHPREPSVKAISILLLGCEPEASKQIVDWLPPEYQVLIDAQPETAFLRRSMEDVTVVICEESMASGRSGLALLAKLHRQHHLVQPILLSGSIGEELLMYAVNEIGALKYLRKPLDKNELLNVVNSAVEMHNQASDIEEMRKDYQALLTSKQGIAYRQRQLQRKIRITLRFARDLLLTSTATVLILQTIIFGLASVFFLALYMIKRSLGIDLLINFHLQDLLSG